MVDQKTTELVIEFDDKQGVIRGEADRPFNEILRQVADFLVMNPDTILQHYKAFYYDGQQNACWIFDADSYRAGLN